jgi:hypothetical protein
VKKAKASSEKSKENSIDTEPKDNSENKKRKRDDTDSEEGVKKHRDSIETDVKKTPLSQTTNSKLANFAFKKDDS